MSLEFDNEIEILSCVMDDFSSKNGQFVQFDGGRNDQSQLKSEFN